MNHKKNLFQHLSVRFSLGFIALAALTLTACNNEEVKTTPAPVAVQAVKVEPQTVPVKASFVAQVESSHQVDIVARVNGFLDKIQYVEGSVVKRGQTLFVMDQKPFIAQVEAARGAMANNQAQLWTSQANLNRVQSRGRTTGLEHRLRNQRQSLRLLTTDQHAGHVPLVPGVDPAAHRFGHSLWLNSMPPAKATLTTPSVRQKPPKQRFTRLGPASKRPNST